ncbi:MAG: prepilin-type N-terminal cleavage/methylation domain-containing protein, partial [Gammaproteobacteria bacterium]
MNNQRKNIKGFTLIEISIVLLIVAILLGYTVALFPVQQELKQYRTANAEMERIIDAVYAYAQVNGRLPCA